MYNFISQCISCCRTEARREAREREEWSAALLERVIMNLEELMMRLMKGELGYFAYSGAVEASGERQLECPICLEPFVHGAACGEVPACRHLFHRECIDPWMNTNSTCPVCRVYIMRGSVPLSAAEDTNRRGGG
jgi:hypothetical protein